MQLDFCNLFDNVTFAVPRVAVAFRSGMSRSKDFWGAAEAGVPIGVVATELALAAVIIGIPKYLKKGGYLFIDSGAFAEVKTGIAPDFNQVLSVYENLADSAEFMRYNLSRLYVVSPDKVGDQLATLARLAQYKDRVNALIEAGCNVIVPIQCGDMPAAEMLERVKSTLGTDQFIAGIPSNKSAMPLEECATLNHHSFHVLGRVQMNADQVSRLQALTQMNPNAELTADANWLRSRIDKICQFTEAERAAQRATPLNDRMRLTPTRTRAVRRAIEDEKTWATA